MAGHRQDHEENRRKKYSENRFTAQRKFEKADPTFFVPPCFFCWLDFVWQGCGEDLADSGLLPGIVLGPVLAGMRDDHPRVRYAALTCVGQMTEDFGDWDGGGGEGDEGSFQGAFHAQVGGFGGDGGARSLRVVPAF